MRNRLAGFLKEISAASVVVIGDVMLDEYIIGDSDRISPEAPEPIITELERRYTLRLISLPSVHTHGFLALSAKIPTALFSERI